MDDVNVNELSDGVPIMVYNKFFGRKIYHWGHNSSAFKSTFRVKDITLCYGGGYRVWCEILSLGYNGSDKINSSSMNLLKSYYKRTIVCDLNLCSIDNVDIVIYNQAQFEIVNENTSKIKMFDFYEKSIKNYSYTSAKDEFNGLTSYKLKFY